MEPGGRRVAGHRSRDVAVPGRPWRLIYSCAIRNRRKLLKTLGRAWF